MQTFIIIIQLYNKCQAICFVCEEAWISTAKSIWREHGGEEKVVVFVVVSRLPRNALVEWQIWAHRCTTDMHHRYRAVTSTAHQLASIHALHSQEFVALVCTMGNLNVCF